MWDHNPRWVRIFSLTSGWAIKAMMRMAPAQRGHSRGLAAYTFLINSAQRWGNLESSGGRCVLSLLFGLLAFPPIDVTEPTIIAEKMFVDTVYECSKS